MPLNGRIERFAKGGAERTRAQQRELGPKFRIQWITHCAGLLLALPAGLSPEFSGLPAFLGVSGLSAESGFIAVLAFSAPCLAAAATSWAPCLVATATSCATSLAATATCCAPSFAASATTL